MTSQWAMMLLRMPHCGITVGNDVAKDIHCDITMGNDFAMCIYHGITMHNDVAMNLLLCITMPNYDIAVSPVNSLNYTLEPLKSISNQ